MSKHRVVKSDFWVDEYVEELTKLERYLFLYLLTNPNTNILGIYKNTIKRMIFETDFGKSEIEEILVKFSKDDKIHFIDNHIIMVNFQKHQNPNNKMKVGISKLLSALSKPIIDFILSKESKVYDRLSYYIKDYVYLYKDKDINKCKGKDKDNNKDVVFEENISLEDRTKNVQKEIDLIISLSNELFTRDGYGIDIGNSNARDIIGLRIVEVGIETVIIAIKQAKKDYYDSEKMHKNCQWRILFRPDNIEKLFTDSKLSPPEASKKTKKTSESRTLMQMFGDDDENEIEVTDYEIS